MVRSEHDGRIAILTLDHPPVNGLDLATRTQLLQALNAALGADVDGIVLWGGPRLFCAGADIEEFTSGIEGPTFIEPTLPAIVATLDAATKPVVAAIAGACLGGGLELALACHARLCDAGAKFGLPEVKLGLLPGAGGTQRLPRLIGIEPALQLILSGEIVAAPRAVELGLAGWAIGDLRLSALREVRSLIGKPLARVSDRPARLGAGINPADYFAAQHALLRQKLPAPRACIDAVALTLDHTVAEGSRGEFALFRALIGTPESRALRYGFFSDRLAGRAPALPPAAKPREIRRVGIVGGGTMGSGIAIACLDAGLETRVTDATATALAACRTRIEAHYAAQVKKGRLGAAAAAERVRQLHTVDGYAGFADCDLVIEAVFEDLEVKRGVFRALDRVLAAGALLASNTSTLDLDEIAAATLRPQDVVGLHFFSPAHVMRLLEVVRGRKTSATALATALGFGKRIGKVAVVAGVCDGFIGNRMFEEYLRQAYALVDEGVLPWRIDAVLENWGMAMGPFAVMDLAGNDIGYAVRQRRMQVHPDRPYSGFPDRIYALGRLGRKSGAGFYSYDAAGKRSEDDTVTALATEHAQALGRIRPGITDGEIIERCVLALVNEGARLLAEGIAERASDLDVVYRHGYGFPAHRGGPLYFADELGLEHVLHSIRAFADGWQGWAWVPAPLLIETARRGGRLTDPRRTS
ncbi:MAG TPA: 3-hydroxyacyl-CoA dehydrogenase NAD-binding domain-containing protein [Steroidobacteraceae bacterium]|nr:3-hydroxyacyl-CoA dehydrogenase NAD-binding domain-containing protein [Steroidobacteraceae bacterium]